MDLINELVKRLEILESKLAVIEVQLKEQPDTDEIGKKITENLKNSYLHTS